MTLGVMALEDSTVLSNPPDVGSSAGESNIMQSPRTVETALNLLRSLRPRIIQLLEGDPGLRVPLDVLDVLKTQRYQPLQDNVAGVTHIGAGVLFLGPQPSNGIITNERRKLFAVCRKLIADLNVVLGLIYQSS